MCFEIRFSGDSNLKNSKFYFVQPYIGHTFLLKFWLKKSPCVLHSDGKVRIFPESDLLKWGVSYMPVHPIGRQIQ